jgi:hypothetical protein
MGSMTCVSPWTRSLDLPTCRRRCRLSVLTTLQVTLGQSGANLFAVDASRCSCSNGHATVGPTTNRRSIDRPRTESNTNGRWRAVKPPRKLWGFDSLPAHQSEPDPVVSIGEK